VETRVYNLSDKPINEKFKIELPRGHKILCVHNDGDGIALFVMQDKNADAMVQRELYLAQVGTYLPPDYMLWDAVGVVFHGGEAYTLFRCN
jgi:hypothetical protein